MFLSFHLTISQSSSQASFFLFVKAACLKVTFSCLHFFDMILSYSILRSTVLYYTVLHCSALSSFSHFILSILHYPTLSHF